MSTERRDMLIELDSNVSVTSAVLRCDDGHGLIFYPAEVEVCPACVALQELRDEYEGEEARLHQAAYDAAQAAERQRLVTRASERAASEASMAQYDLQRSKRRSWQR